MVDPQRWGSGVDPHLLAAGEWVGHVFGGSETAVALLTALPGLPDDDAAGQRRDRRRAWTSSTVTRAPGVCSRTRSCTRTWARRSSNAWSPGATRSVHRRGRCTRCGIGPKVEAVGSSSTTTATASRSSSTCARSAPRSSARTRASPGRCPTRPRRRVAARHRPRGGRVSRRATRRLPLGLRR